MTHTLHLHRPSGSRAASFQVLRESLRPSTTRQAPKAKHHIIVIDRSGSMYSSIRSLRDMVSKLLALQEYAGVGMKISLISYSSAGDCTLHFRDVPVEKVDHSLIQNIEVTGLTCISQALEKALSIVDPNESTMITLHSDGFANDRSPWDEHQRVDRLLEKARSPSMCINTVAYSRYSDFPFLDTIATKTGGKSTFAVDLKATYEALQASMDALKTSSGGASSVAKDNADFMIVIDPKSRRILGSTAESMYLHGISEDAVILRLYRDDAPKGTPLETSDVLGCARAFLGMGLLPMAKQAIVTSKDLDLFPHLRSILPSDLGEMALALENAVFDGTSRHKFVGEPKVPSAGASILSIAQTLRRHKEHVLIHMPTLLRGYRRMSVKMASGKRDGDGNLIPFEFESRPLEKDDWSQLGAVEVSTTHPNLNIRIDRPAELIRRGSGEVVSEVAGIKLARKISLYNNYTIVSDGRVCVPTLKIRASSKNLWSDLADLGVVPAKYDPTKEIEIDLSSRNLVEDAEGMPEFPEEVITRWATVKILQKLIAAVTRGTSTTYSDSQIEALKEVGLSPALNFSPPTVMPYVDRAQAIATGVIDTYVAYEITVGSTSLMSMKALKSGNEMFGRYFTVKKDGKAVSSPKLPMLFEQDVVVEEKVMSSRTKLTAADDLQRPIIRAFLGKGDFPEMVQDILDEDDLDDLRGAWLEMDDGKRVSVLSSIGSKVDEAEAAILADYIHPLVFMVGSTGTFPDEDVPALDADALEKAAGVKLGSSEREGTFFLFGESLVLGVFPKARDFSP